MITLSQSAPSLSCSVPLFRSCLALSLSLSCTVPVLLSPCPALSLSCLNDHLQWKFPLLLSFSCSTPPSIREAAPTCSHHHLSRSICGANHSRLFHADSAALVSGLLHRYHPIKPEAFCPWPWASPTLSWILPAAGSMPLCLCLLYSDSIGLGSHPAPTWTTVQWWVCSVSWVPHPLSQLKTFGLLPAHRSQASIIRVQFSATII